VTDSLPRENLELAADHCQWRTELVRRVRDERGLAIEGILETVQHVVEGIGQDADLVAPAVHLHPLAELTAVDARRNHRHTPQRRSDAGRNQYPAQEGGEHGERAGEQKRVEHAVLCTVGRCCRLADADARGGLCGVDWNRPDQHPESTGVGQHPVTQARRRGHEAACRLVLGGLRARGLASLGVREAEQLGLVRDRPALAE